MSNEYRKTKTTVSFILYHFVFCPRYRRKILVNKVEERFKELVQQICREHQWHIVAIDIKPDHCYLYLNCLPTDSPSAIMAKLKGVTSRAIRQEFVHLSHLQSLWTRSFFVSTADHISKETIKQYVESQKKRG